MSNDPENITANRWGWSKIGLAVAIVIVAACLVARWTGLADRTATSIIIGTVVAWVCLIAWLRRLWYSSPRAKR
jgi:hypothetical protein